MAVDMEYLQRVGSAYAIAELQVAIALEREALPRDARILQEVLQILEDSDGNTEEHQDFIDMLRRTMLSNRPHALDSWIRDIKTILSEVPVVGTDVPEWDSPTHPLKSLEELFPEYCGDK
jgi:hypothetical protein